MNPFILDPPFKAKPEIQAEANQKQEYKYLGTIRLTPWLKLWSFNVKNFELKEVETKKTKDISFNKKKVKNDQALYNQDCIYFQSLNIKNAKKKANKIKTKILCTTNNQLTQ